MEGGLLDLRKITPGHRLSLTFMHLVNMCKCSYVYEVRERGRERERILRESSWVLWFYVHLLNVRRYSEQITRGTRKLSRHLHGIQHAGISQHTETFFRPMNNRFPFVPLQIARAPRSRDLVMLPKMRHPRYHLSSFHYLTARNPGKGTASMVLAMVKILLR